ncbi:MAG: tetratricopeptide repeat protein, partial [Terriglobales bacterium]
VFSGYLERHPTDSSVRLEYARNLGYARRFSDALGQYQAVLQAEPDNVAAQVGLAKVFSWQDNLDTALQLYDKVLSRNPQSYDAIVGKAFTLMWMGRKNDARNLFQAAQRRNPSDRDVATALRTLGPAPAPLRPREPAAVAQAEPPPATEEKQPEAAQPEAPAEVAVAPGPPAKSEEETFVETLLAQAEGAAAKGNYVEAVHQYHRVLERDPRNLKAKLQIARVLSWSKNYGEAAVQYEELLRTTPENQAARQERARVLSWDTKFADSIAEYERVLKDAEATRAAGQAEQISINDARLEYARVLSWAQRYDDAMAQFDLLLPDKAVREPKHKDILIEKARVQAWSRHYDQSVETYDQALVLAPSDFEARLGKAQATFWSGKLDEAALQLQPLLAEQPKHPETSYVLAAVERGRGHNGRALGLLKNAPQNQETEKLRSSIREDLRPILRLRYGFEDSREISATDPTPSDDSTYTAHRYSAGIEFFPHPDVSLEIFNTVTDAGTSTPALARHGTEGIATETMARVNIKASPWLRLLLGAGGGTGGTGCQVPLVAPVLTSCPAAVGQENRRQHFLYEIHPVITRGDFRLEVIASRRLADYTPVAIHDNVIHRRETLAASYFWRRRVRLGAEYWHATYNIDSPDSLLPAGSRSFEAIGNGGSFWVRPILFQSDRLTVDVGFRTELFAFDDDGVVPMAQQIVTGGFFTPHKYERYAATGHVSWDPHPRVHWELDGSLGPQRVTGFTALNPPPNDFGLTGSFGTELSLRLGRWRPFVAYNFFSTATIASPGIADGAYRSHGFAAGLSYRF